MKIRYVLLEMKNSIRFRLEMMLEIYKVFECVGSFSDIVEAAEFVNTHPVDVVFADIKAGDAARSGDATFLCSLWACQVPDRMTVLFGDDRGQAYLAMQQGAFDFFTLPTSQDELLRVVGKIRYQYDLLQYKIQSGNRVLLIRTKNGYQMIEKNRILFVERNNRKNRLVTTEGKEILLAGYTMEELEGLLSVCGFYRCYQSFIVNPEKITEIRVNSEKKMYELLFDGYEGTVLLSREKYAEILELLKERYARVSL